LPRNSFPIQIKSSADRFDVSGKLDYPQGIEVPFFVGVVDREKLSITIYSGEYIPALFSLKGIPEELEIEVCERVVIEATASTSTKRDRGDSCNGFPRL
jgi:hypothetical protein